MNINILQGKEAAKEATGIVVVIDVFRAFSTLCYFAAGGVEKILIASHKETVYQLKDQHPDYILIGERGGHLLPGAQYGNSPFSVKDVDFTRKTIVFSTSAGTRGVINSRNADEVLTGAFVNVGAIISYVRSKNPETVSLLCTGTADEYIQDEDAVCARYIQNALLGKQNDFESIMDHLKKEGFANHFFDPKRESHPVEDFDLCMTLDRFDFIFKVESFGDDVAYLEKIEIKR